jgi:hypothetical protein
VIRRAAIAAAGVALASVGFVAVADPARATSSLNSPAAVGMAGELAGTLTPAESAAFAQIANATTIGSGATAAKIGSSVPVGVGASAGAGGLGWRTILTGVGNILGFTPLLLGGMPSQELVVPSDLGGLPSGSGVRSGVTIQANKSSGYVWANGSFAFNYSTDLRTVSWVASYSTGSPTASATLRCYSPGSAAETVASLNRAQSSYTAWSFGSPSSSVPNSPSMVGTASCAAGQYVGAIQASITVGGQVGNYYSAPPAPSFTTAPNRWVEQTVTCKRADGSTHDISMTGTPQEFTAGALITVLGILCPDGEKAVSAERTLKTDGGTDLDLGGQTWPDTSSIPSACASGGTAVCEVRLQYRTGSDPDTWANCPLNTTSVCTRWQFDPKRADNYRCQFGTGSTWATVGLSSCTTLPTDPETPTPPWTDVESPTSQCEFGWGDVLSGEIVYKAVGCALSWAFVPEEGTFSALQTRASTAWSESPVGVYTAAAAGGIGSIGTIGQGQGSSCDGLNYEFPILGDGQAPTEIKLLDACTAPMDGIASIVKAILSVVTLAYGVWACVRLVGVAFGWNIGRLPQWEQGELF